MSHSSSSQLQHENTQHSVPTADSSASPPISIAITVSGNSNTSSVASVCGVHNSIDQHAAGLGSEGQVIDLTHAQGPSQSTCTLPSWEYEQVQKNLGTCSNKFINAVM